MKRVSLVFVMAVVVGCGGPSDEELLDLANRDPRCVSACTEVEADVMGAGDSCNTTSRVQCLDECEVRIAGTSTVCANCLVENVCFGAGGCEGVIAAPICTTTTCTVDGPKGSCTYPANSRTGYEECMRQVAPAREVTCTAEFRATSECTQNCN